MYPQVKALLPEIIKALEPCLGALSSHNFSQL
jgi:hypothetical protein